jgi:hypothetical protein
MFQYLVASLRVTNRDDLELDGFPIAAGGARAYWYEPAIERMVGFEEADVATRHFNEVYNTMLSGAINEISFDPVDQATVTFASFCGQKSFPQIWNYMFDNLESKFVGIDSFVSIRISESCMAIDPSLLGLFWFHPEESDLLNHRIRTILKRETVEENIELVYQMHKFGYNEVIRPSRTVDDIANDAEDDDASDVNANNAPSQQIHLDSWTVQTQIFSLYDAAKGWMKMSD